MQILLPVVILVRDVSKRMVLRSRQISATREPGGRNRDLPMRSENSASALLPHQCETLPCKLSQAKQRKCKLLSDSLNGFSIDFSIDFVWSSIVQTNSGVAVGVTGGPHSVTKMPDSDSKHAPYQSRIELTELRVTARHGAVRRSASCLLG